VNDGVGGGGDAFDPHLTAGRVEKGEQFGGAVTDVLVGLLTRASGGLPTGSGVRNGLIRTGFVLTPDLNAQPFAQRIGRFYGFFLASRSASSTTTEPLLRMRTTCPV